MLWYRNLKIGSKLLCVVAALLALMAFLTVFGISELAKVNATSTDIEVNWLPSVRLLGQMQNYANVARRGELRHLIATSDEEMAAQEHQVESAASEMATVIATYEKLIASEEERQIF